MAQCCKWTRDEQLSAHGRPSSPVPDLFGDIDAGRAQPTPGKVSPGATAVQLHGEVGAGWDALASMNMVPLCSHVLHIIKGASVPRLEVPQHEVHGGNGHVLQDAGRTMGIAQ